MSSDTLSHIHKIELMITDGTYYAADDQRRVDQPAWFLANGTYAYSINTSLLQWDEGASCTITSKAIDAAGNTNISIHTFTYENPKEDSQISCNVSQEKVYIGEPFSISGQITHEYDHVTGVFVGLTFFSPDRTIHLKKTIIANGDGFFSYPVKCGDINQEGEQISVGSGI